MQRALGCRNISTGGTGHRACCCRGQRQQREPRLPQGQEKGKKPLWEGIYHKYQDVCVQSEPQLEGLHILVPSGNRRPELEQQR